MNTERLLEVYARIAEAPDAIARMRQFVLDLAVRGKLVDQDAGDEPASRLASKLASAKQRLVESRQIKKPKSNPPISPDELPIDCPPHWEWLRLTDIGRLSGGMTPSKAKHEYWDGSIVWLSPKDIKSDELDTSELKITEQGLNDTRLELYPVGSLFIVARSGILKRTFPVAINRVPAASNQDLKVLTPFMNGLERYLQIMFRGMTDFLLRDLVKTGTTVQSLKYAEFEQQAFPIPPLAEQHRIVAKVDELMALCDRLEEARNTREETRDKLTAASLARVTAPETSAEAFPACAQFALDALPSLTSRPDQIKTLRQTILNLAVRGKLVGQDPADEPALEQIKVLRRKREQLISGKLMRKPKTMPPIEPSDFDFNIPERWEISRLGEVYDVRDGTHDTPKYVPEGIPLITSKNLSSGKLVFDDVKLISLTDHESISQRSHVEKDDILFAMIGSIGNPVIVDTNRAFSIKNVALFKYFIRSVCAPKFLRYFLEFAASRMRINASGGLQPFVSLGFLRSFPMALPPLAEQHRIVAKVDVLMALCDQLEATLITTDTTRTRLLEALLHEALEPATGALEAAD